MTNLVEMAEGLSEACPYVNGFWKCRGDGYLWDADSDGWVESDTSYPCPQCNTEEYLRGHLDHARGWSSYQWIYTSGAEHWQTASAVAIEANRDVAIRVLNEIGPVECDHWRDPERPSADDMVKIIEMPPQVRNHLLSQGKEKGEC